MLLKENRLLLLLYLMILLHLLHFVTERLYKRQESRLKVIEILVIRFLKRPVADLNFPALYVTSGSTRRCRGGGLSPRPLMCK